MKNVLLVGDSWPAGELAECLDPVVLHRGVQQYFVNDGVSVLNLCSPGGSNLLSINKLDEYLLTNNTNDICIIFWVTEFFRNIWWYTDHNNASYDRPLQQELNLGYEKLKEHWIYRPYYKLQELAQKYNVTINLLGGCSDTILYDDFNQDFPNLNILCQSLANYIVNDDPCPTDPVFCLFLNNWVDPFLRAIKKTSNTKDLELLVTDIDKGRQRLNLLKENPQWFYPDGIHPNRFAHEKIYKLILDNI
jgi:hypothetical protein